MGEVGLVAVDDQHDERGAHAAGLGLELGLAPDADRRLVHRVAQPLAQDVGRILGLVVADEARLVGIRRADQGLVHGLGGHRRRDLAGGVAAHAVRHDEDAVLEVDEPGVLVVFSDRARLGACVRFQLHALLACARRVVQRRRRTIVSRLDQSSRRCAVRLCTTAGPLPTTRDAGAASRDRARERIGDYEVL